MTDRIECRHSLGDSTPSLPPGRTFGPIPYSRDPGHRVNGRSSSILRGRFDKNNGLVMRKFVLLAVVAAGAWQLGQNGLGTSPSVEIYDDTGNPVVKVITIDDCGKACRLATDELKRRRVAFEEIRIDPHDSSDDSEDYALWKRAGRDVFPLVVSGDQVINGSGTPAQMATLLGRSFDDRYLTSNEKRYFQNHFYADGTPRVVVYGADWCPDTAKLRRQLDDDGIDHVMIDVEKSGEKKRLAKTMEIYGYPATWVGYTRARGVKIRDVNRVIESY